MYLSIAALAFLSACGGRSLSPGDARDSIARLPAQALQKEDIDVVGVRQVTKSEAIVESKINAAFRLEKTQGHWVVREVRLGHGQWESIRNLTQALQQVKVAETQAMLEKIAGAIQKYREANGSLPPFKDYVSLSDLLSPKYMTPLIRLDSWRQPLAAEHLASGAILIRSAGPDGEFGTEDDICRSFPP